MVGVANVYLQACWIESKQGRSLFITKYILKPKYLHGVEKWTRREELHTTQRIVLGDPGEGGIKGITHDKEAYNH